MTLLQLGLFYCERSLARLENGRSTVGFLKLSSYTKTLS